MKKAFYPYSSTRAGEFFAKALTILFTGSDLIKTRGSVPLTYPFSSRVEAVQKITQSWRDWGFEELGHLEKIENVESSDPALSAFRLYITIPEDSPFYPYSKHTSVLVEF